MDTQNVLAEPKPENGMSIEPTASDHNTKNSNSIVIEPRLLCRSNLGSLLNVASDGVSLVAWFGMLTYAALLWFYRECPVSSIPFSAQSLISGARPLSTLFSIIFAATFGRLLRSIAHWLLERGAKIGLLDQLISSSSVSSALAAQVAAGHKGALGVQLTGLGLVCLWLLSPLGSQAVLQISSIVLDYSSASKSLPLANAENWANLPGSTSDGQLFLITPNTILNAALISPLDTKNAHRDIWGHVKIPIYDRMSPGNGDNNGWREVRSMVSDDYSSLIGIPIGGLPEGSAVTELTLQTWYWNLTCRPWEMSNWQKNLSQQSQVEIDTAQCNTQTNITTTTTKYDFPAIAIYFQDMWYKSLANGSIKILGNRATAACKVDWTTNDSIVFCPELDQRRVAFEIFDDMDTWYSNCSVASVWLDTAIKCMGRECEAQRVRLTPSAALPSNWTALDYYTGRTIYGLTTSSRFFANLAGAIAGREGGGGGSNALAGYIANPGEAFSGNRRYGTTGEEMNLRNVTDDMKTNRLAQVLNTYWLSSTQPELITGTDSTYDSVRMLNSSFVSFRNNMTNMTLSIDVVVKTPYEKLHCKLVWLIAFTLVSFFALLSSLSGLVLVLLCKSPRLAMNVSTMVRNNKYVNESLQQGSYLDDTDRTRLLYDVGVCIGDIAPSADIGHIALVAVADDRLVGRLHKDRMYG